MGPPTSRELQLLRTGDTLGLVVCSRMLGNRVSVRSSVTLLVISYVLELGYGLYCHTVIVVIELKINNKN